MAHRLLASVMLLGASLAAVGPVLAQASPEAPTSRGTPAAGMPVDPAPHGSDPSPPPAQSSAATSAPTPAPAAPAPAAPAPAAPATSPAPAAPAGPSADTLKKARLAGYHPETRNGAIRFCREDANLGTRFTAKKCISEDQLKSVLDVHNLDQDGLRQPLVCAAAGCMGH
jgi:hypothetical protein